MSDRCEWEPEQISAVEPEKITTPRDSAADILATPIERFVSFLTEEQEADEF